MPTSSKTLIDLENKFWQAIVDEDADTATDMLTEPALMVSSHGAMQFDHDGYRQMAKKGLMVLKSFELSDMKVMFPNDDTAVLTYHVKQNMAQRGDSRTTLQEMNDSSTWVRSGGRWLCVMHTESPAGEKAPH